MKKLVTAGMFMLVSLPAQAGSFTPPEGCETYLTVQTRACRVSNHYTCAAQPGDKWRVDYDQEGPFFISRIDYETQWIESYEPGYLSRQALDPNPADPASFTDLLSGRDDFDFSQTHETGEQTFVTGYDRLTGKTYTIDGVELKQTEYSFSEHDSEGNLLRRARGNEYISPEWRLFFSGPSEWWDGENWLPMDGSPVQFILPGEPGFAATQPIFECSDLMSELPDASLLQKARHEP